MGSLWVTLSGSVGFAILGKFYTTGHGFGTPVGRSDRVLAEGQLDRGKEREKT